MVHGRRDANPGLVDMLRQIVTRLDSVEIAQCCGRHLHGEVSNDEVE